MSVAGVMDFRVLGPVEAVAIDGRSVALGGAKQRAVLAMLALDVGKVVSVQALIEGVWGEDPPEGPTRTVQVYVSNLRKVLGADVIVTRPPGYLLDVEAEAVDLVRFRRGVVEARSASDPVTRSRLLSEALELWRGPALADLVDLPLAQTVATGLDDEWLAAREARIDADLAAGSHDQLVGELEGLVEQHPLRERLHGQLMLGLYRSGRQADALAAYERVRATLAEELGLDPSTELRELHERILRQDPALDPVSAQRMGSATDAPSGLVTFVFTDIEGSTRLLHRLRDRYVEVLERHRDLLRAAWSDHRGFQMSVEADSVRAAFADPNDAVAACVAAQRSLAEEAWPEGVRVPVRMGVHTGLASPRGGDYVALAVHEAARVVAAAHGGQILVSEATAGATRLPDDLALRPLGGFRLRGFDEPVRLFQVEAEGLDLDFPAVRAVPGDRHNLVPHPTETVGRDDDIAALEDDVTAGRLLTLVGPGGVGKTRLVADLGLRIAPAWDHGVWFVDLADVGSSVAVRSAIADVVRAPTRPGRERWDDAVEYLEGRRAVLILDNCEHVPDGSRQAVADLLARCRDVAVVATSRHPLYWKGETVWRVAPLGLPSGDPVTPQDVLASPAGRLFAQRASAVAPGFAVDGENAAAVATICRRLDGLPLLIELAAAQLAYRSPVEILAGLEERLGSLQSKDPSVPERHRTVDGLLSWSYQLLSEDERSAFRRLSAFGASFDLEGAAAAIVLADGIDPAQVPVLVWELVDRSLVVADRTANGTRYRMLETVRSYARERLEEHRETGAVAAALAGWFGDRLGPWVPADRGWTSEVAVELDNLRSLIPLIPAEHEDRAQLLACAIGRYHDAAQSFRDGIRELTGHVASLREPCPTRVSLLTTLADLHLRAGEVEAATRLVDEAETLRATHGAPEWDDVGVDRTRGEIARRSGDLEAAVDIARSALDRPLSDRGRSRMHNLLGITLAAVGDLGSAYRASSDELRWGQEAGFEAYVATAHGNLAETAMRLGDLEAAARHQRAALDIALALGSPMMVGFSLIVAARIAGAGGDWSTSARLHARAGALLAETGIELYADDRRRSDELLADARRELGDENFTRESATGRDTELTEAVRIADSVLAATAGLEVGANT